jgi:flagellar basal-body rod modification protein FlgD
MHRGPAWLRARDFFGAKQFPGAVEAQFEHRIRTGEVMTSPTSGISGTPAAAAAAATSGSKSIADKAKDLGDKDTFLKLLVAQLKYQDPSNPADSTQFLAQTAQFTQVEKLGDIADLLKSQRMVGVSSLVGHEVTYMDPNGARQTGVVSAAKLNGDSEPMLRIGNTDVELSKVMEVQSLAQSAGSAALAAAAGTAGTAGPVATGPTPTGPTPTGPTATGPTAAPAGPTASKPAGSAAEKPADDETSPATGPATA